MFTYYCITMANYWCVFVHTLSTACIVKIIACTMNIVQFGTSPEKYLCNAKINRLIIQLQSHSRSPILTSQFFPFFHKVIGRASQLDDWEQLVPSGNHFKPSLPKQKKYKNSTFKIYADHFRVKTKQVGCFRYTSSMHRYFPQTRSSISICPFPMQYVYMLY